MNIDWFLFFFSSKKKKIDESILIIKELSLLLKLQDVMSFYVRNIVTPDFDINFVQKTDAKMEHVNFRNIDDANNN